MRIICWNMQRKKDSWGFLADQHDGDDLALLQEACTPVPAVGKRFDVGPGPWNPKGASGARAIVGLSGGVELQRFEEDLVWPLAPILRERPHSIAFALATLNGERILAASVEMWSDLAEHLPGIMEAVREATGFNGPAIVGGDINTERHSGSTVFDGMAEIGIPLAGPDGVTKYNKLGRQQPSDADRQYDYVFATPDLAARMSVEAVNAPTEWGPSDHCRVVVDID